MYVEGMPAGIPSVLATDDLVNRLRELRKRKVLTQEQIAGLTEIDQSDYSKIELGKRNLTFEQCRRLAIALETSMDYLANMTDNPIPYERIIDN